MKNLNFPKIVLTGFILWMYLCFVACDSGVKKETEQASQVLNKKNVQTDAQKIIKEATLDLKTKDPDATILRVKHLLKDSKAYISEEDQFRNKHSAGYNLTIRIPCEKFDSLLNLLADSLDIQEVERKNIKLLDVTEEYVDMEARIKVKKETEKKLLELLSKAGNVSETLEIEKQLSDLRSDIEAVESKLKSMNHKIMYSTLYLSFYKEIKHSGEFFSKTCTALKEGWQVFLYIITLLSYLWVVIVVVLLSRWGYIYYKKAKKLRKF